MFLWASLVWSNFIRTDYQGHSSDSGSGERYSKFENRWRSEELDMPAIRKKLGLLKELPEDLGELCIKLLEGDVRTSPQ